MASGFYNRGLFEMGRGMVNLSNDTIKVALCSTGYTFDKDHSVWSTAVAGPLSNQITGAWYTAGGQALSNQAWIQDDTNDWCKFDADDALWVSATIANLRYAVYYNDTHASDVLLYCWDMGSAQSASAADLHLSYPTNGIFVWQQR